MNFLFKLISVIFLLFSFFSCKKENGKIHIPTPYTQDEKTVPKLEGTKWQYTEEMSLGNKSICHLSFLENGKGFYEIQYFINGQDNGKEKFSLEYKILSINNQKQEIKGEIFPEDDFQSTFWVDWKSKTLTIEAIDEAVNGETRLVQSVFTLIP